MPSVCLDASFVLAILLDDPHRDAARQWMSEATQEGFTFVAPTIFHAELTSIIRERVYRRDLSSEEALEVLAIGARWPVSMWRMDNLTMQESAYELATRFNQRKAYDAQYLAVASSLGCELWTADRHLVNTVAGKLPWVRWIGAAA